MFPIQCDHMEGRWPRRTQCRQDAKRHLLYHKSVGFGADPQVLLLCEDHFHTAVMAATRKCRERRLALSNVVKETGKL